MGEATKSRRSILTAVSLLTLALALALWLLGAESTDPVDPPAPDPTRDAPARAAGTPQPRNPAPTPPGARAPADGAGRCDAATRDAEVARLRLRAADAARELEELVELRAWLERGPAAAFPDDDTDPAEIEARLAGVAAELSLTLDVVDCAEHPCIGVFLAEPAEGDAAGSDRGLGREMLERLEAFGPESRTVQVWDSPLASGHHVVQAAVADVPIPDGRKARVTDRLGLHYLASRDRLSPRTEGPHPTLPPADELGSRPGDDVPASPAPCEALDDVRAARADAEAQVNTLVAERAVFESTWGRPLPAPPGWQPEAQRDALLARGAQLPDVGEVRVSCERYPCAVVARTEPDADQAALAAAFDVPPESLHTIRGDDSWVTTLLVRDDSGPLDPYEQAWLLTLESRANADAMVLLDQQPN